MANQHWPVLKSYQGEQLARIALPIGGIGTGTVSLGGRGDLRDWEIVNRPAKGFVPHSSFFALRVKPQNGEAITCLLEGPLDDALFEGPMGSRAPNHGLPRFENCAFDAAYPLGQVLLSDSNIPVEVRLQAFNPLIPADADRSGIPVAVLRYELTNVSDETVDASVCGSMQNFIGRDGTHDAPSKNKNEFRVEENVSGVFLFSEGVPTEHEAWGTMALAVLHSASDARRVTHRTAWTDWHWGHAILDFWDDFHDDGKLDPRTPSTPGQLNVPHESHQPFASIGRTVTLAPRETQSITFLLTWHFPNRKSWHERVVEESNGCCEGNSCEQTVHDTVSNYYTTQYSDAWDVATKTAPELENLETETVRFVRAFCESTLPNAVREAALFNLSTLRTQTTFRTPDGNLFGWEGCNDKGGCCAGSCTHVWNYEQATPFLFGELSRTMRDVEFHDGTNDDGLMSFRINLPLDIAKPHNQAAADGQMGCLMKLYRDWQLCGDDEWLKQLWPRAKKTLEFCWIEGGWDGDRDGVMEGCQHNTMDVEYYGPNPQMQGWYLGALRACEEMAKHLGEDDFAAKCRELFEKGSAWMDEHLFNGEYYEHEIRPISDAGKIAPGLVIGMGGELKKPAFQLGAGCLIDQLVGQYMAHICGLGYLHDRENVKTTLRSLMRHNYKSTLKDHFNPMRSYALADEAAMLMATYPRGNRPEQPFPYFAEVMTGFEYTAAVGMVYEDQIEDALKVISSIRDRYDGRRRSPFNEAECGHHYARAMASWAAVLALTGFEYSAVTGSISFAASDEDVSWFWSNGATWGTLTQKLKSGEREVILEVLGAPLTLRRIYIGDAEYSWPDGLTLNTGESYSFAL